MILNFIENKLKYFKTKSSNLAIKIKMILFYLILHIRCSYKNERKNIYVKIANIENDRYLYLTLKYLELGDYNIIIYDSLKKFIKLGLYGRLILTIKNLHIVPGFNIPNNAKILSFDPEIENPPKKQIIQINFDYFNNLNNQSSICIPYFMHPFNYKYFDQLPQLRNNKKTIPLLCYGSANIPYETSIKTIFNCIPRTDVCNFLLTNHQHLQIEIIKDISSLEVYKNKITDKILFIDESKCRIPTDEWLFYLSKAHFFLALPGYAMPLSHNIIEAISVGTIPITQYNKYINPELINEHTCLEYDSLDKLSNLISNFHKIEDSHIAYLRANILNYYEKYINPINVLAKLEDPNTKTKEIIINAEEQSMVNILQLGN